MPGGSKAPIVTLLVPCGCTTDGPEKLSTETMLGSSPIRMGHFLYPRLPRNRDRPHPWNAKNFAFPTRASVPGLEEYIDWLAFQTAALTYERSGNLNFSPAQQMGLPDKRQAYWSTYVDVSLLGDH